MMPVDEAPPLHASDMALGAPIDYTKLPGAIDSSIDKLLDGAPVRPTSLEVEGAWSKETSPYLLGARQTLSLDADALVDERNRAFDLLDALTKSGELLLYDASVHVVLASTHTFEQSVFHTVTRDNIVRFSFYFICLTLISQFNNFIFSEYSIQHNIKKMFVCE